jgi:hypothetical protein
MDWITLVAAGLVVWALCGAVMALGPRFWSMEATLRIHLAAAPLFSFALSIFHAGISPGFPALLRALVMTAMIIVLDAVVVAPLFERSFAMFRSIIGTWLPFLLMFLASWFSGTLV